MYTRSTLVYARQAQKFANLHYSSVMPTIPRLRYSCIRVPSIGQRAGVAPGGTMSCGVPFRRDRARKAACGLPVVRHLRSREVKRRERHRAPACLELVGMGLGMCDGVLTPFRRTGAVHFGKRPRVGAQRPVERGFLGFDTGRGRRRSGGGVAPAGCL